MPRIFCERRIDHAGRVYFADCFGRASTATTRAGIACCVSPSLTPTTASLMPMWGRLGAQATIRYSPTLGCYSRSRPTQRSVAGGGRRYCRRWRR
eukprot:scaffold13855_cov131-Isochrysis_galbana.AAC.6